MPPLTRSGIATATIVATSAMLGAAIVLSLTRSERVPTTTMPAAVPAAHAPIAAPAPVAKAPAAIPRTLVTLTAPYLRPADTILSFGKVPPSTALRQVFVLHNDGGKPLLISKAKPSCGCAAVKFDKEIPAGGTGTFEVAISAASVKPGKLSHHIELKTNDPNTWLLLIEAEVDSTLSPPFPAAEDLLPDTGLLIR